MVGVILGSGIFQTPTEIASKLADPWIILAFWLAGGVLSLLGAFTYAELATMLPQSGGIYVFLREAFGRPVAFIFGWTYMLVTKPFAAAGIAIVLASNLNALFHTNWDERVVTIVVLIVLTAVNARGTGLGASVAGVLTSLKILALLAIVVLGVVLARWDPRGFLPIEPVPAVPFWSAIVPVMAAVLWTYDGWSDVGAIAGEVKRPSTSLWKIYTFGTLMVTALYLAVNAVYLGMLPLDKMRSVPTVAPDVMQVLIGPSAGWVVAVIVIVSTLGSTHSSILTGARVTFQQARDGLLFGFLGRVHPRFHTPAVALWVQCALSCAAVIYAQNFTRLAGGFVFTMWIFYGLGGLAIFVLRVRKPDLPRPFRCPGYPVVPALFVLSAVFMTVMTIYNAPDQSLPWLGVLIAGGPVYWVWQRFLHRAPVAPR